MSNVSHITVSGTTYDITPAGSPYAAYSQIKLPSAIQTFNSYVPYIQISTSCDTYALVQFRVGSNYYLYKTTDFKTWTALTAPASGQIYSMAISNNGTHCAMHFNTKYIYVSHNSGSSFTSVAISENPYPYYGITVTDDGVVIYSKGSSSSYYLSGITASNTTFSFSGTNYGGYLDRVFKINNYYCFSCKRGPSVDTNTIYVSSTTGSISTSTSWRNVDTSHRLVGVIGTTGYCCYYYSSAEYFATFTPSSSGGTVTTISQQSLSTSTSGTMNTRDTCAFTADGLILASIPSYISTYQYRPTIMILSKNYTALGYPVLGPITPNSVDAIHIINNKIYILFKSLAVHMIDKDSLIYIPGII